MNAPAVVMDNGSAKTRVGYAGMMEPSVVVSSAIGMNPTKGGLSRLEELSHVVGTHEQVLDYAPTHEFRYMLRNGIIHDWDALEQLWHSSIYDQLRCDPEEHNFLISESPFNSPENREQMAEILFETFNIAGLYIGNQPILSMVASWGSVDSRLEKLTGTVVDTGDGTTTVIPVADGRILRNSIQQIPLGGRDITSYVQDLLRKNRRSVSPSQSFEVARQIKEQYGYVCSDLSKERHRATSRVVSGKFASTDHWKCTIEEEQYLAGEVLFQPSLLKGSKSRLTAVPDLVDTAIQLCPIDIRRELYSNIVLSSGSTMFRDFGRRLQRDVSSLANNRLKACRSTATMDVNVVGHSSHSNSAWLGGSIVGSDSRFHEWIKTKEQYEEEGPRIARHSVGIYNTEMM